MPLDDVSMTSWMVEDALVAMVTETENERSVSLKKNRISFIRIENKTDKQTLRFPEGLDSL